MDDVITNGYEQTPELVLLCNRLAFTQTLIENQKNIIMWCKVTNRTWPGGIPQFAAHFAEHYPDSLKFIDECERTADAEIKRLELERKSLMLKFEAVKARTPYNPTIPFKK